MSGAREVPYASVLVPTHDRFATLPSAIASIQQQTVRDIEIVIVGDGVTERVRTIARQLAAADPRITFNDCVKTPGRGGHNRDSAVNDARSDRIFYCDDDDLLLPDHVAALGPVLDKVECADSQAASVSVSGWVQLAIVNHQRGFVRDALASHRARAIFDTHFAHRKATYQRLGPLWTADQRKIASRFLSEFARKPTVTWRTLPKATALSFHGAARRHLSAPMRTAELATWSKNLSPHLESQLAQSGHYDWHIFTIANAADFPPAMVPFFEACKIGLIDSGERSEVDVVFPLSTRQAAEVAGVFALLSGARIPRDQIAPLAIRLTDPLVGTRPRSTVIARLLAIAVGCEAAVSELRIYQPPDDHSHELREYLLLRLLLENGRLEEAEAAINSLLARPCAYPAVVQAFAADLARRRNDPRAALDHARSATGLDGNLPEACEPLVWALARLGQSDKARSAVLAAEVAFEDSRFTQRLMKLIDNISKMATATSH